MASTKLATVKPKQINVNMRTRDWPPVTLYSVYNTFHIANANASLNGNILRAHKATDTGDT